MGSSSHYKIGWKPGSSTPNNIVNSNIPWLQNICQEIPAIHYKTILLSIMKDTIEFVDKNNIFRYY